MKILVLNKDWSPVGLVSLEKAVGMYMLGKCNSAGDACTPIMTINGSYMMPTVLVLNAYRKGAKNKRSGCSHKNIYVRDGNRCAYCKSTKSLTIDHIMPKARGGENGWMNMVSCCHDCNAKKGNRTPEEAGMKLLATPYVPSIADLIYKSVHYKKEWDYYVAPFLSKNTFSF